MIDVRRDVLEATHGKQVPWDNSSLTGEVVLNPVAKLGPAIADTGRTDNAAELAFWDTIKASTDRDLFDAYLQQYPNGLFVSLAKAKIRIIERAAAEQPAAERRPLQPCSSPHGLTSICQPPRSSWQHLPPRVRAARPPMPERRTANWCARSRRN
ncbi:hypothetical protein AJ87_35290 [Rhizobium yanglingense]|nr:hypothetical protein AJ87_35290 [Rhizobium yanglingense]